MIPRKVSVDNAPGAASSTGALACVVCAMLNQTACRSTKPRSEEPLCYSTQIHNVTGELETRVKERFPQVAASRSIQSQ